MIGKCCCVDSMLVVVVGLVSITDAKITYVSIWKASGVDHWRWEARTSHFWRWRRLQWSSVRNSVLTRPRSTCPEERQRAQRKDNMPVKTATSNNDTCDSCGRTCGSRAGLHSHKRSSHRWDSSCQRLSPIDLTGVPSVSSTISYCNRIPGPDLQKDLKMILGSSEDHLEMMTKLRHTYNNLTTMLIYKKNLMMILR